MDGRVVPPGLAARLGPEASGELVGLLDAAEARTVNMATERAVERFERRLTEEISGLRIEMIQGHAALRQEMAALGSQLRQEMTTLAGTASQETVKLGAHLRQEIVNLGAQLRQETANLGAQLRQETTNLGAELRQEMAGHKVDLLKWSFLFWIGQVITLTGIMSVLLRTH